MGKLLAVFTTLAVFTLFLWEYTRVTQYEKDVVYHHYQQCTKVKHDLQILDLTRFGNLLLGVADDLTKAFTTGAEGVPDGHLLSVEGLSSGNPTIRKWGMKGFPAGIAFHPRGHYLYQNTTLFVMNFGYKKGGSRIEILNVTESGSELQFDYYGHVPLPEHLQGKTGDLIVNEDNEIYVSQYCDVGDDGEASFSKKLQFFTDDFFQRENSYVHRCTFTVNTTPTCRELNNTQAVSVTGISKDKFGDFYVAYGSMDFNWIGVYERNWRNGDLDLKQRVPVRDRPEKIDWDEGWQRVYGGAIPYPHLIGQSDTKIPGGVIEMKNWDFRSFYIYRSLMMQTGELQLGGTCSGRQGPYLAVGSYLDPSLLVCPITSPTS